MSDENEAAKPEEGAVKVVELPKRSRRKTADRLAASHAEIVARPPTEIDYLHTVLCQTSLPYKPIKERHWEQQQGEVFLSVDAGMAKDPKSGGWIEMPVPSGEKPRLLLIFLDSEATRTGNPVIEVAGGVTAFVRSLGLETNGANLRHFRQQMMALAAATVRMAMVDKGRSIQVNENIIAAFDLWSDKDEAQGSLFSTTVRLSDAYFSRLTKHAVPLDHRAIAALAGSAMALDVYAWLVQRLHRIPHGQPQPISWEALRVQFGSGYGQVRFFRRDFLNVLQRVTSQYPAARINLTDTGLELHNSPPPVPKRLVTVPSLDGIVDLRRPQRLPDAREVTNTLLSMAGLSDKPEE